MAFEQWNKGGGKNERGRYKPTVTLYANGQVYLSVKAINVYQLQDCKYLRIFFDRESCQVGFIPSNRNNYTQKMMRVRKDFRFSIHGMMINYNMVVPQYGMEITPEKLGDETIYTFKVELNPARVESRGESDGS